MGEEVAAQRVGTSSSITHSSETLEPSSASLQVLSPVLQDSTTLLFCGQADLSEVRLGFDKASFSYLIWTVNDSTKCSWPSSPQILAIT